MKKISVTCEKKEDIVRLKEAGADEIIVALKAAVFSSLCAFEVDEIKVLIQEAKRVDISIVVLMNRLFPQSEIALAGIWLKQLLESGVDAVIFADPGLYAVAKESAMEDKLIYHPETLVTSAQDADFWLSTGIQSVNISPLLTEEEILHIAENVRHCGIQAFGYLLMSISKRSLLSAYEEQIHLQDSLRNQSGLYLREDKREGMMPVFENEAGTMIYTDFIQESFAWLQLFAKANIERFEMYGNHVPFDALLTCIRLYKRVLAGADGVTVRQEFIDRYPQLPISDGYYGQKTVR